MAKNTKAEASAPNVVDEGLVVALGLHLTFGCRLLLIELGRRYDARLGWVPAGIAGSVVIGLGFVVLGT